LGLDMSKEFSPISTKFRTRNAEFRIFTIPHLAFGTWRSVFVIVLFSLFCGYPKKIPPPVEVIAPGSGETIKSNNVHFQWKRGDFLQFHLQVALDSKFKDIAFEDTAIIDTVCNLFLAQSQYYYRLRGKSEDGQWGGWSETKMITVEVITLIGEVKLVGYPNSIEIVEIEKRPERYVLVASGQAGLEVIDLSEIRNPKKVQGYRDNINSLWGVKVSEDGDYGYLAYGKKELEIVELSLPETILVVGANEYSVAYGYDLEVDEERDKVYCAAREQFITFDISNPENPYDLKKENFPSVRGICREVGGKKKDGDYLYLACEQLGIYVYQITDSFPIKVGYFDTPNNARDVWVKDTLLFVADGRSLTIISVATKTAPFLLYSLPIKGYAQKVFGESNYLFLACGEGGLYVYDISSLPPRIIARLGVPYARCVSYKDGFILLGDRDRGLLIYELKE